MTKGLLYKKLEELKWLPDDMEGFDEVQNEKDKVVTALEYREVLDEAKQNFPLVYVKKRKAWLLKEKDGSEPWRYPDGSEDEVVPWFKKYFGGSA